MQCKQGGLCQWVQGLSQLAVAAVVVFAGYTINKHMEAWTHAFNQGSQDLHNVALAMEDIKKDMSTIRVQMDGMNVNTYEMNVNLRSLNERMDHMNGQVNGVRQRLNPMRMMMPW
jgi:archaellum component FlaC